MSKSYKTNSCKKAFKPLQELNLIDSFLFGASTEKIQDAEFIAKLIIERATYENQRLAKVYDIEPNKYNSAELPMRSRYCQSLTDVKLLNSSQTYETLPDYISIWILPYDPFGKNQMLYTVKNSVVEFPELIYNDGVKKLFLYTGGELGGTEKLKSLLQYFSDSNTRNATDTDLKHLHSIVECAKYNQEVGKRYMTLQDMIDYEKKESFDEGIIIGIHALISSLKELNIPTEQIMEQLMQKFSLTKEEAKVYLDKNN